MNVTNNSGGGQTIATGMSAGINLYLARLISSYVNSTTIKNCRAENNDQYGICGQTA